MYTPSHSKLNEMCTKNDENDDRDRQRASRMMHQETGYESLRYAC